MQKITILALIDEPFINTYETLFFEANNNTNFDFHFVAIKNNDVRMGSIENYTVVCNMLKEQNIPYIDGYDVNTGKQLDVKNLNPDIVLLQTPYDGTKRSHIYSSEYISSFAKLIHISYGSTIIDYDQPPYRDFKLIESNKFFDRCWFSVMENSMITRQFNMYHPKKFKSFGYIKLDKYLNYKNNPNFQIKAKPQFKYIIAWKPRWFASKGDSNFLTYIDYFKKIIQTRKDILLLFVSHPLLKNRLVQEKIYTEKEVESLFNFLKSAKNVKIVMEGDFLDDIYNADIFIGDYSSTIVEAAILNIPIIYTPTQVSLSAFGKCFLEQAYVANNEKELDMYIENLINGKDFLKNKRKEFIKIASPKPKSKSYALDLLNYIERYFTWKHSKIRKFLSKILKKELYND